MVQDKQQKYKINNKNNFQ